MVDFFQMPQGMRIFNILPVSHRTRWTERAARLRSAFTLSGFSPRLCFPSALYDQLLVSMTYKKKSVIFAYKHLETKK